MAALKFAHRGYEYQDLLVAYRLVDVMLGSIRKVYVDEKLVPNDRFDDLTTLDETGHRERTQIKHTGKVDQVLTLATFIGDARHLRLDCLISSVLADRNRSDDQATKYSYRIILRDKPPTDMRLLAVLELADPDPGHFVHGLNTVRMSFSANALWEKSVGSVVGQPDDDSPFEFLQLREQSVKRQDLDWVCERLVIELNAPSASLDLTNPGPAEQLLLKRVRDEVGAGVYPNTDRTDVDVAEALIHCARAARQGTLTVSASELLRRTRLRNDFGAVSRRHPVNKDIEVSRPPAVSELVLQITAAADEGKAILLLGPPGQGKSWICKQVVNSLLDKNWLVAEHYCYLGDADRERLPRVHAESVFGSLLGRIAEHDSDLVSEHRPKFAANEQALEDAVDAALKKEPSRRVVLVVDGIDHVTRVIGGGATVDPSFMLAKALAALNLPTGSTLIVLSQPGTHLKPLEEAETVSLQAPGLTDDELKQLAVRLGVIGNTQDCSSLISGSAPLHPDEQVSDEFVATLSARSAGNALYATYLCRETLRTPTTMADPSGTVCELPQFDGSLRAYYEHIQASLKEQGAWVADVIALLDFSVSRSELKEIRPDAAHRVDHAIEVLRPVLSERATQSGVRIYHESFARFLRLPFQNNVCARIALLDKIIEWLESKGMFKDSRAFRYLLRILSEANYNHKVVDLVTRDFVIKSIAHGFPASAIIENLATAISSAAYIDDWPAVVRYVEMSRSAETYQEERFESEIVGFADVIGSLLGTDTLAERLLYEGSPTMSARSGLQMCAVLDAMGAVPPWREYMLAFIRESRDDNTIYGEDSDWAVETAILRGRLRLASFRHTQTSGLSRPPLLSGPEKADHKLYAPIQWEQLAKQLDESNLHPTKVVDAVLDTFGLTAVVELIEMLARPSAYYVALAESIASGKATDLSGDAHYWALRAVDCDFPSGCISRLIALGIDVDQIDAQSTENALTRLQDLTRNVQNHSLYHKDTQVAKWIDACTIAAKKYPVRLAAIEALLEGPGWYTCWLRFVIALVIAEAKPADEQSELSLQALHILTEVQDPFLGKPRACDLYPIYELIDQTICRAISLLDDPAWEEALELLDRVSNATSTTISGEMSGPLSRDRLLHLVVNTATLNRQVAAQALVDNEIENGGSGRYYSDLAEYRLIAARLAAKMGDLSNAHRHWTNACCLLTSYGWHKDTTVYELLDPLPELISVNPQRGRIAVAKLQPLCERIPNHTDGKETRHTWSRWWKLLVAADPCALPHLIQQRLLSSCNDPNWLLHGARSDLWRAWHHRADPIVAGTLRLTLEEPLDHHDPYALGPLADMCEGPGCDKPSHILTALLARVDERPVSYAYSNSDELLDRDCRRVDKLNMIAARAGVPRIASLPSSRVGVADSAASDDHWKSQPVAHLTGQVTMMFQPGMYGVMQAIHAWRDRRYDESRPSWSAERFANVLGYRIMGLVGTEQEGEIETVLRLIADAGGYDDRSGLLQALAEGLERHGQNSLAVVAYTLAWTRRRGRGGWLTFGGEAEIESLQRATKLDRGLALKTVAGEVTRVISREQGSLGITQALMHGFARGGLGTSSSVSFDIWDEAFAVIADRAPRVATTDDPDDVYTVPDPDGNLDLLGDIDTAFATAAVAGLAHASREQKRRSLIAIQMLIDRRPSTVTAALKSALTSLSDPATLTWLLRVIELSDEKAVPIISASRTALIQLARGPHLTVRALARRLLSNSDIPMTPLTEPDPELLKGNSSDLLLPAGIDVDRGGSTEFDDIIDELAGVRLSRAEQILPGMKKAVSRRVYAVRKGAELEQRMGTQLRVYASRHEKLWPDAFLASDEAVEDAIQRVATGARAARLMNAKPAMDPIELEESLAQALLNDAELPLAVEETRQPRPKLPPPPPRGDPLWQALLARAGGESTSETGVQSATQEDDILLGTVEMMDPGVVPILEGGPYNGWRLIATVEQRLVQQAGWEIENNDITTRFRVIELYVEGDQQVLILPPVTKGDIRAWNLYSEYHLHVVDRIRTQPIVGYDISVQAVGDGHHGLGVQRNLLTPTNWLFSALVLKRGKYFVLDDKFGAALALITWRTEYEVSDYHLAWPRLDGAGLVVRDDIFNNLIRATQSKLIFRDFLKGPTSLCS